VRDPVGGSTHCHACGTSLIARNGYEISHWRLTPQGHCNQCGAVCPGVFAAAPGHWGSRRAAVRLSA